MRTDRSLLVLTGCMLLLAPASAPASDPVAKQDPSKRICKIVTPTGSRMTQRVCKTAEDWKRDQDYAQSRIEENGRSMRDPTPRDQPTASAPR